MEWKIRSATFQPQVKLMFILLLAYNNNATAGFTLQRLSLITQRTITYLYFSVTFITQQFFVAHVSLSIPTTTTTSLISYTDICMSFFKTQKTKTHRGHMLKKVFYILQEERRRTGRYMAILVGISLFILALYHAWVRRIPIVASLVVPALIMFVYVAWILYTASREKHRVIIYGFCRLMFTLPGHLISPLLGDMESYILFIAWCIQCSVRMLLHFNCLKMSQYIRTLKKRHLVFSCL